MAFVTSEELVSAGLDEFDSVFKRLFDKGSSTTQLMFNVCPSAITIVLLENFRRFVSIRVRILSHLSSASYSSLLIFRSATIKLMMMGC